MVTILDPWLVDTCQELIQGIFVLRIGRFDTKNGKHLGRVSALGFPLCDGGGGGGGGEMATPTQKRCNCVEMRRLYWDVC
eukprot:scaffold4457_cov169-Amphora_coffeaeformis.AAC.9